jgi:nitrite reductase (NADH) small subunit
MPMIKLGPVDLIPPGEGRAFRIGADDVAVFRTRAGALYGVQATCPHRAAPLADGMVGGGRVVCALHSLVFDLADGRCLSAPSCGDLRTYPVTVGPDGEVEIALEAGHDTEAA